MKGPLEVHILPSLRPLSGIILCLAAWCCPRLGGVRVVEILQMVCALGPHVPGMCPSCQETP